MNILITGATGFVGANLTKQLIVAGHKVTCFVRNTSYAKKLFPNANLIHYDFINGKNNHLQELLTDIDILINAVGIFSHPNEEIMWQIHYHTPKLLFTAAASANIKKIIHISALGIDDIDIPYAKSKKAIETFLLSSDFSIPTIILRPSVIYGSNAFGGMELFRGLAGLPLILPVPGRGDQQLQPIYVEDLAQAVVNLIDKNSPEKILLTAVGPNPITFLDFLKTLRQWLMIGKPWVIAIPKYLIYLSALLGSLFRFSMINLPAFKLLMRNNVATQEETKKFQSEIRFTPRNLIEGIFIRPSSPQDRWHAHLFFLKPLLRISLSFMWFMSALTTAFLYPVEKSYELLQLVGISGVAQPIFLYGAVIVNLLIGIALLFNIKPIKIGLLQLIIILIYTLIISFKIPQLWLEPFGPITKNIPVMIAVLIYMGLQG